MARLEWQKLPGSMVFDRFEAHFTKKLTVGDASLRQKHLQDAEDCERGPAD